MSNFYIADLHLSHKRVIEYDNRPFKDIEDNDKTLINNWNSVVSKNDTVYVIGDFIWIKEQEWPKYLEELKGNIVLIKGNHDPKAFSKNTKAYFSDIKDYKEITDNDKRVILCHYPILFFNHDFDDNSYMLYGHVHNSVEYEYIKTIQDNIRNDKREHKPTGNFINVGCMMPYMSYTPRKLDEIITRYNIGD